ncbi:Phosphotransferase enzyme family protein [Altererythrobacter xiamenensis]|uniref:Phosphotransferase enzyme family protein n=1 Tax=Altererythrobacter xiamenensis TaxID=1316679 RepID=A0A1Y6FA11_9SPHN|nr:Phosphotransferase enzyme family protein [Altererythrobacter xiamenensis]
MVHAEREGESLADFPSAPEDVTPDWVDAALRASGSLTRGRVAGLEWQPIGTGQVGDSARFTLTYDGESDGPSTIAGKFPAADETSRGTAAMFGLYAKEVCFYREIAPTLGVRVPSVHAAHVDDNGGAFVLLFEDLGPARGGDQIAGCTLAEARRGIEQAAAIHAPSWNNADILDLDWLQPSENAAAQVRALYPQAQAIFAERYADLLEPEYMAVCERLATCYAWLTRQHARTSLVHGDFRLDNMLFDIGGGAEPIAVLDWQTLTIGTGLTDVGYFLGCGIGDELRRVHEDELLDLYCEEMSRRGVPLTRQDIWRDYIIGALHGVSTAVFSAAFVERTERGDANFLSMARGACALALAHDSIGMLEGG